MNTADDSFRGGTMSRGCWRRTLEKPSSGETSSDFIQVLAEVISRIFMVTCSTPEIRVAWHSSTRQGCWKILTILPQDSQQAAPDPWNARSLQALPEQEGRDDVSTSDCMGMGFLASVTPQWRSTDRKQWATRALHDALATLWLFPSGNLLEHKFWKGVLNCWVKH